ncbi:MAG: hypothetical protein AAFQ57_05545 [Cyanobacteria bacterium J06626_14]
MVFPQPQNNRFVHDIQVLFKRKPVVMSAGLVALGLTAIALGTQFTSRQLFSQNNSLQDESPSPSETSETLDINGLSEQTDGVSTDIDTLEVLLGDINLEEDPEQLSAEPEQSASRTGERRISSLLDPTSLAITAAASGNSDTDSSSTSSIYEDLFQPITLSNSVEISPLMPSLLSSLNANSNAVQQQGVLLTDRLNGAANPELSTRQAESYPFTSNTLNAQRGINGLDDTPVNLPDSSLQQPNPFNSDQQNPSLSQRLGTTSTSSNDGTNLVPPEVLTIQTSPRPGTTGYTPPQALQSPVNPYTQQINPQVVPTIPGQVLNPSSYVVPNYQSVPSVGPFRTSTPFSPSPSLTPLFPSSAQQPTISVPQNSFNPQVVPSSPTTRFNGGGRGGEINTFSNP